MTLQRNHVWAQQRGQFDGVGIEGQDRRQDQHLLPRYPSEWLCQRDIAFQPSMRFSSSSSARDQQDRRLLSVGRVSGPQGTEADPGRSHPWMLLMWKALWVWLARRECLLRCQRGHGSVWQQIFSSGTIPCVPCHRVRLGFRVPALTQRPSLPTCRSAWTKSWPPEPSSFGVNWKPQLTGNHRHLKARNAAFRGGDEVDLRTARAKLSWGIREAERQNSRGIVDHFNDSRDTRNLWWRDPDHHGLQAHHIKSHDPCSFALRSTPP